MCFHLRKLGSTKKYRQEQKQFICDGIKLLNEAIESGIEIDAVLTSEYLDIDLPKKTKVYKVSDDVLDSISPLCNANKVVFSCKYIKEKTVDFTTGTHVLLDSVQDPGNVGTIIRNANAFGISSVILTGSTADIYSPKVIRSTMGAIFRQNILFIKNSELIELKDSGLRFICAENSQNAVGVDKIDLDKSVIVMGNEGKGVSKEISKLCDTAVKIPLLNNVESINVASATTIFMWEAMKGRE